LTEQDLTTDGDHVLTLQALIRARMDERGWSYAELERRSAGALTKGRWQQLGTGVRMANFPEPTNLRTMADVLEVEVTTVLLAAAQTLGIDARRRGPDLAQLLPAGTDRLSERMRDAILTIIRAAVADTLADESDPPDNGLGAHQTLSWRKVDAPSRRNNPGRSTENRA
jgi:hypothetical protein